MVQAIVFLPLLGAILAGIALAVRSVEGERRVVGGHDLEGAVFQAAPDHVLVERL